MQLLELCRRSAYFTIDFGYFGNKIEVRDEN